MPHCFYLLWRYNLTYVLISFSPSYTSWIWICTLAHSPSSCHCLCTFRDVLLPRVYLQRVFLSVPHVLSRLYFLTSCLFSPIKSIFTQFLLSDLYFHRVSVSSTATVILILCVSLTCILHHVCSLPLYLYLCSFKILKTSNIHYPNACVFKYVLFRLCPHPYLPVPSYCFSLPHFTSVALPVSPLTLSHALVPRP